jgi:hypothetical protein
MLRFLLTGFLLLLLGPLATGQEVLTRLVVRGTVRDSATGQPLRASVVADFNRSRYGTEADEAGRFTLRLAPGERRLAFRHVGYAPTYRTVRLRSDTTFDVAMTSLASQLELVIVTSKGYDQTVRQPLLGVNQLSIATLKKLPSALGEVDLLRGLQLLPGVTSVGEAANGVNIRGGTTDQNLLLLDGAPIFNPTHLFGLFSVFPTDAVGGVDLYKGNVPARYGGRTASVLDVSLRTPDLERFRLNGGISLVSNRLTADIPLQKERLGLLVSVRGAFNDFLLPLASSRLDDIRARFVDGTAKLFYRLSPRQTLTLTGYFSDDRFETDLLGTLANVNALTTRYDHQTLNATARWAVVLSSKLDWQTTIVSARYVPQIRSPEVGSDNEVILRSGLSHQQLSSSLNWVGDRHKTEAGLSLTRYGLQPGELVPGSSPSVNPRRVPTERALEAAVHVEDERQVGEALALSVGLRYVQFFNLGPATVRQYAPGALPSEATVTGTTTYAAGAIFNQYGGLEPRVGLRYTVSPAASIKLGYNHMRQYLQVVTNTTTPLPTARWKTADPHLRPQISDLVTAGWFQNLKDNVYELSVEGYYRRTRNVLDYRPGADFLLQPYPETELLSGRGRAYGVEVLLAKKKSELTGWLSYTYARTLNQADEGEGFRERINGGNWYPANYDRPHSFNASMTVASNRYHAFSLTFVYSTGRPYTAPEGYVAFQDRLYPYYAERNQRRLPDYHRLDFSWTINNPSLKSRRWEGSWVFTIYNLYGRKNVYSVFFRSNARQRLDAYQLQILAAPLVSLTYNFRFS